MVFGPALEKLAASDQSVLGPTSFRSYVTRHDLEAGPRTPRYISVDALSDLAPELREADVMVLRTGSAPDGRGTGFLLVESHDGIEEFFLCDESAFDGSSSERLSMADDERLESFELLPSRSETSLVNLGLASGALAEALSLDRPGALSPPATGRSTFTFEMRPHGQLSETVTHRNGQVEIDTLFVERRGGERTLFVLEAKTGPRASLAKHKLVYPVLALAERVPPAVSIVPVYLRCRDGGEQVTFAVAECTLPDPRESIPGVNDLEVTRSSVIELER
ncbi:DUF6997 domain-containing protein [Natrarchaeobaculum sulfurireducens]|uniref:DUF6997 domain-containing protein n=1 Tax=Natrarchaeobaculum sulfurireducens TaxID=2044521 RepID=A0A346PTW7_9EURY|nr:hypothetical protein [Natrarchaeobaculum sulfurireducens]AXR82962.1 hypothetical protein AArcMg_2974 [Natrarchaeobaculum sulfurireducens]